MIALFEPRTLDEFRALIKNMPGPNNKAAQKAALLELTLTKPMRSLGRLEELSQWISSWQNRHPPKLDNPRACIFAGNHGVAKHGVSAFPEEVTSQMITNFLSGGAAVNQLCRVFDVDLTVNEITLDNPTADFTQYPAMNEKEFLHAVVLGMKAVEGKLDLLCLGEMGIANTTSASAVCHALFGNIAHLWTGPGSGVKGEQLNHKISVVTNAVRLHKPQAIDAIDVLLRLGGRELVAIVGAIVAARYRNIPVILDGYVCCSAAAALHVFYPGALDHCQVGHVSAEPGHRYLLKQIGKKPLLDLNMCLGEASGAVIATGLVRAAIECHTNMASFHQAGVSNKKISNLVET